MANKIKSRLYLVVVYKLLEWWQNKTAPDDKLSVVEVGGSGAGHSVEFETATSPLVVFFVSVGESYVKIRLAVFLFSFLDPFCMEEIFFYLCAVLFFAV